MDNLASFSSGRTGTNSSHPDAVIDGLLLPRNSKRVFDTEDRVAQGMINPPLVDDVASRLWIIVLSDKQEKLVISAEDRAILTAHRVREEAAEMTDDFAAAIADLSEDDPERNIASIKNAVIAQLLASDDRVKVETTEYFNHTYAPDLILRWNTGRPDRRVYLRTNTNPVYLLEDVDVVSANHPILIPLRPVEHAAETIPLGRTFCGRPNSNC